MNKIHQQRIWYVALFLFGLALATALILYALKQNINVFLTPKQIAAANMTPDYYFRLGGLVKEKSVVRDKDGLGVQFIVTDLKKEITVRYVGGLPDLFREGKGVVAEGHLNTQGVFIASQVLAKHDENYMPKNVYEAIREAS